MVTGSLENMAMEREVLSLLVVGRAWKSHSSPERWDPCQRLDEQVGTRQAWLGSSTRPPGAVGKAAWGKAALLSCRWAVRAGCPESGFRAARVGR